MGNPGIATSRSSRQHAPIEMSTYVSKVLFVLVKTDNNIV